MDGWMEGLVGRKVGGKVREIGRDAETSSVKCLFCTEPEGLRYEVINTVFIFILICRNAVSCKH